MPPFLSSSGSVLIKSQPLPNGFVAKVIIFFEPALIMVCPLKLVSSDNTCQSCCVLNSFLKVSKALLDSKNTMTDLFYFMDCSI